MNNRAVPLLITLLLFAVGAQAGTEIVLKSFGLDYDKGNGLYAGLVMDPAGNLYGAAESGGPFGAGVVYKLSPNADQTWTETVL